MTYDEKNNLLDALNTAASQPVGDDFAQLTAVLNVLDTIYTAVIENRVASFSDWREYAND